ncbi:MAG: sigma-54-dependent Fis family transcriptional regulator [Polyangiaceae bacterium]|nr:sigma-54-dependent Fis family transcriptional regulator [Polyangiaceae bacterium]
MSTRFPFRRDDSPYVGRDLPVLNLVSFDGADRCQAVVEALARIGYAVRTRRGCEWLSTTGSNGSDEVSTVFWGRAKQLEESVLPRIQHHGLHPSVVIFQDAEDLQHLQLPRCCAEFLTWPCSDSELRARIERVTWVHSWREDQSRPGPLPARLADEFARFNMIGRSPKFVRALHRIQAVSRCEAPVLLEGETGTGKELAARAIHYLGARRGEAFVPVNCGAIQDGLMESELFGHRRGAFTGAADSHLGLVAQAEGGTLFLDEVEALSKKGQITLLRFLQDLQYRMVGGTELIDSNVRIIAASNTRLAELVTGSAFRPDLFYRLAVMSIQLPPLRQREEDLRILAEHFLRRYRTLYGGAGRPLPAPSLAWLSQHSWPGNIRELENYIHRSCCFAELPLPGAPPGFGDGSDEREAEPVGTFSQQKARVVRDFERQYLARVMEAAAGNVTVAARRAGKERRAFGRLLKKHRICPASFVGVESGRLR